jgi:hypothetical protein
LDRAGAGSICIAYIQPVDGTRRMILAWRIFLAIDTRSAAASFCAAWRWSACRPSDLFNRLEHGHRPAIIWLT